MKTRVPASPSIMLLKNRSLNEKIQASCWMKKIQVCKPHFQDVVYLQKIIRLKDMVFAKLFSTVCSLRICFWNLGIFTQNSKMRYSISNSTESNPDQLLRHQLKQSCWQPSFILFSKRKRLKAALRMISEEAYLMRGYNSWKE